MKRNKILGYVFIIGLIVAVVLRINYNPLPAFPAAATIIFYLLVAICALISIYYITTILYCVREDKKLSAWLNADNYDELIPYSSKKLSKKALLVPARKDYYRYLLLLSYLAKDDVKNYEFYFEEIKDVMFRFPMTYYWKACVDFSNDNYQDLETNTEKFKTFYKPVKNQNSQNNLLTTLSALNEYAQNKKELALITAKQIDQSRITMPATKRALAKIFMYKPVNEENKPISEEQ